MENSKKEQAYLKAKTKVDRIRGFYIHLIVYVVVNIGLSVFKIIRNIGNGETFTEAILDGMPYLIWMLWGIGLALHAFSVFGLPLILGENWEEDRIKKYMNEDQSKHWD